MTVTRSAVTGVGSYLPDEIVTNADLAEIVDTSDEWIVERTGMPCLGVLPWLDDVWLDGEDALSIGRWKHAAAQEHSLTVAVVRLPRTSNATDVDALAAEPGVEVRVTTDPSWCREADLLVLPGSRATVSDLAWLRSRGLDAVVITDPENLMYLTDYQTTGYSFFQALVVPLDDEPVMITRAMEESNVIARTWVERTRPYPDTGDAIQELVLTLKEGGLGTKRVGYERNSYFFPAYQQDRVHTSFQQGVLMDCFGIVEDGEPVFRDLEREVTLEALRHGGVVCLGGGGPMTPEIAAALDGRTVVLLDVGIADAARRVGFDRSRPLLAVNPRARWIELMAARRPTYERLATRVVDTAGRTPAQVASAVLEAIGADDREAGR